jgi:hypothetical protein
MSLFTKSPRYSLHKSGQGNFFLWFFKITKRQHSGTKGKQIHEGKTLEIAKSDSTLRGRAESGAACKSNIRAL